MAVVTGWTAAACASHSGEARPPAGAHRSAGQPAERGDAPGRPGASRPAANAPPSFEKGAGPSPPADLLWRAASGGDPLDLARLANREGAAGLLEAAARGGHAGRVALAALPHAPDGAIALGWLCTTAPRATPSDAALLLDAIAAISAEPPRDAEQPALRERETCRRILAKLATEARLSAHARDLAASARRMLEEHVPESKPYPD